MVEDHIAGVSPDSGCLGIRGAGVASRHPAPVTSSLHCNSNESAVVEAALAMGARLVNSEKVVSPGFIELVVNEDKAKTRHLHKVTPENMFFAVMVVGEGDQVEGFVDYLERIAEKRVILSNLADSSICKVVKPSDASRYFPGGRRRIKAKIHHRLGRWYSCPGFLLSLTFAPDRISRRDAWKNCRTMGREFINRVNRWRKRHGMPRAKFLTCIELQPGTGYPHLHFVFPYLKWLSSIAFMTETWGQGVNAVDMKPRDCFSPVG